MNAEQSMNDKIRSAFSLSSELADLIIAEKLDVDADETDLIFGHADGLSAKHLYGLRDGRCSPAQSMAFDPAEAEKRLDIEIREMQRILDAAPK